jgi:hypothetical protein
MRSRLNTAVAALALVAAAATPGASATIAEQCPEYSGQLEQARNLLVRQDRTGAIAALRAAQAALGECIRRQAEQGNAPVLLAWSGDSFRRSERAGAARRLGGGADQSCSSDWRSTRSTSAGSTFLPASS